MQQVLDRRWMKILNEIKLGMIHHQYQSTLPNHYIVSIYNVAWSILDRQVEQVLNE
jgi:hypothetical protein